MANDSSDPWKKLNWENKASLCEQARASENYLLHVYMLTFTAVQAILFALLIKFWGQPAAALFAIPGTGFAILWAFVTESRGNHVDLWEEELHKLWNETSQLGSFSSDVANHYKGAAERRGKRENDRWATFKGWGRQPDRARTGNCMFQSCRWVFVRIWLFLRYRFQSSRWVFVMFIPLILVVSWMVLAAISIIVFGVN